MLASAAAPMVRTPAASRPNFIILYTDDHGYHDLGCQGAADLKTPNLDALAASGARFTDWYSCAPVCAPSRAALMTGRYPIRAGVPANGQALRPTERTIAAISAHIQSISNTAGPPCSTATFTSRLWL